MGNRAVIAFRDVRCSGIGIYLHSNGGRASVEAFLRVAKDLGVRADDYGIARLCQIIGNYFGGSLSIGCGRLEHLDRDNGDNGVYRVKDWKIIGRDYFETEFDEVDPTKTDAIYKDCMSVNGPIFGSIDGPKSSFHAVDPATTPAGWDTAGTDLGMDD